MRPQYFSGEQREEFLGWFSVDVGGRESGSVTNLNVISMFTVAERKSQNSKLITWGGWLAGWRGTKRIFISPTLIDLLRLHILDLADQNI